VVSLSNHGQPFDRLWANGYSLSVGNNRKATGETQCSHLATGCRRCDYAPVFKKNVCCEDLAGTPRIQKWKSNLSFKSVVS